MHVKSDVLIYGLPQFAGYCRSEYLDGSYSQPRSHSFQVERKPSGDGLVTSQRQTVSADPTSYLDWGESSLRLSFEVAWRIDLMMQQIMLTTQYFLVSCTVLSVRPSVVDENAMIDLSIRFILTRLRPFVLLKSLARSHLVQLWGEAGQVCAKPPKLRRGKGFTSSTCASLILHCSLECCSTYSLNYRKHPGIRTTNYLERSKIHYERRD